VASLVGGVKDLVIEDGEVEGKTKADGVGRGKLGLGNLGGSLVRLKRLVGRVLALVANGELGKVAVVVTLPVRILAPIPYIIFRSEREHAHLVVEHLGLAGLSGGDKVLVENGKNILADLGELGLDLLAVLFDKADLGRVALGLLLLLDRGNDSPRRTASANDVLVGNRQKIPLLDSKVTVFGGNELHVLNHLCRAKKAITSDFESTSIATTLIGWQTYPRSAQPARRAWPGKQHLRDPFCRSYLSVRVG